MVIVIFARLLRNFYSAYLFRVHIRISASIFTGTWRSATRSCDGVRGDGLLWSGGAEGFIGDVVYMRAGRRRGGGGSVYRGRMRSDDQGQRIGLMMNKTKQSAPGSIKVGMKGDCCQVSPWSDEGKKLRLLSCHPVDGNVRPHSWPDHPTHHARGRIRWVFLGQGPILHQRQRGRHVFLRFPQSSKTCPKPKCRTKASGGRWGATVIVPNPKYILSQVIQAENQQRRFQRW